MFSIRRALVGAVVAAVAVAAFLPAGPAQAASGDAKDRGPAALAEVNDRAAPDRMAGSFVATSSAAAAALATIQERIAQYVATHGTEYTFGSYLDPATGDIVLETDAPARLVSSLADLSDTPGATSAQRRAADEIEARTETTTDAWHRRDDIPAYWGGAGLRVGGGLCSSGYAVQNSAGTRFSVTAGHCYANGATVLTESSANTYGTVSNRRLPTVTGHAMDFELVGGQSYAGRIYTGGVTSTSSIPVVAAGAAVVNYNNYCHSGRTTGQHCGHTSTSITAQVCTATGCKQPVIAFTGGTMIQGGDSGGTFYATDGTSAWIRGNVIATNGTTGWAQPWTVIASELNVSIVTG